MLAPMNEFMLSWLNSFNYRNKCARHITIYISKLSSIRSSNKGTELCNILTVRDLWLSVPLDVGIAALKSSNSYRVTFTVSTKPSHIPSKSRLSRCSMNNIHVTIRHLYLAIVRPPPQPPPPLLLNLTWVSLFLSCPLYGKKLGRLVERGFHGPDVLPTAQPSVSLS